ncbi:Na+/H+ antiporter [Anaerotardibacter muris]|uniref:Na+/H+ antiporter n=1 Tax=Anaerotardibacter muris TaxID=2941505 RepID=UPI00203F5E4E|nr:Na+/H+ antiporter [Anaerotardibacter muris]
MATFELILLLAVAVLLSSVLDQIVPKVSLPLIQIGLGFVIAALAFSPISINIEPELFLILFIAPLLFSDAKEANKKNLWDNRVTIVSFAIGLVLAITLCVGFTVHWLIPSIPLAAAFALGAALGPTDAVAVQSLRKEASLGKREGAILQGEALINDASGVVSFQFSIAAAITGAFSLIDATESFAISFFGGIAFGILLAAVFLLISSKVRDLGLDSITFHVLFEISMPFVVFLVSELIHVSGILAVVACGIVWSLYNDRKISPYRSSLNIALSSVWKVIGFTLNGIVFVLLGMQLPMATQSIWNDVYINNIALIGYVLLITLLIVVLRWLWAILMLRITKNPETHKRDRINKRTLHNALVTTVGGPKGAITLSIIFSIPFLLSDGSAFPQRSLIIFIASGVILCTLLIANFALPILAPKHAEEDEEEIAELEMTRIEILRTVIERLIAESTPENDYATKIVVSSYNNRIASIRDSVDIEHPSSTQIRIQVINHQANMLIEAIEQHEVDAYEGFATLRMLLHQKNLLTHRKEHFISMRMVLMTISRFFKQLTSSVFSLFRKEDKEESVAQRIIRIACEREAINYLHTLVDDPRYPSEVVAKLLIAHERTLAVLKSNDGLADRAVKQATTNVESIQRTGLLIELEVIADYATAGRLTRQQAKEMRDNVALMMLDLDDHI